MPNFAFIKERFLCGGANLRSDFEGELPYSGNMDSSPKRKTSTGGLMAGETKTSVMRQEMNSGKGNKSKWSWKDREDDMRELERKGLEQKREIQKLKKQNETMKGELDEVKERLATEQNNEILGILASGQYLDSKGNNYIILKDDVAKEREDEVTALKSQIEKLERECNSYRDGLYSEEEQKNSLITKLDSALAAKEETNISIQELLRDKEELELEKELETQKLRSEFETVLKDLEYKLQEREKEGYEILNEKKGLLDELNEIVGAKKQLEFEMDNMNCVVHEQVQKIDELSTKIFGRDGDLRNQLDEVERAREECKLLQDSNNVVEKEQEAFINGLLSRFEEIIKILQDVEYRRNSHECDDAKDHGYDLHVQSIHRDNNNDTLIEELNLSNVSSDSIDPGSPRSTCDINSKFEEVKNLLLQKIGDIDSIISSKDFQINKNMNQVDEWKTNCEKIEEEARKIQETYESLLEMKDKDNQDLRDQNENIRNECNEKTSSLDKLHADRLAGIENSDAYYREHIETITNDFEKKMKEQESALLEHSEYLDTLQQESNYLRNEIQSKERELSDMSRKYESSLSQVEAKEKELREENETYLSEEIDRIQFDCKNKVKQLEAEKESNEIRITSEYEDKITELQLAFNRLKTTNTENTLRNEFAMNSCDVTTQCDDPNDDDDEIDLVDYLPSQRTALEEELQKVRESLVQKIREFELLQAKYDAQHRLVEFVTLSLEQERAKKNNSNDEILTILEKLEQKVSETFQFPNNESQHEYYMSETSINSMMTESLPDTLYANTLELNTTWPPKYNARGASPIRRWSSLGVLEHDQAKRKELIERLREEISCQLNGMSTCSSTNGLPNLPSNQKSPYGSKLPKPWSSIMDDERSSHVIDHLSNGLPNKYGKLSLSTPSVNRTSLMKNKISHDSGLDQNDEMNELISFPNQLHNVIEMFRKLKEQHEQLKEDNSETFDKQWSNDLENWKNRVQYRLNDLKPCETLSERTDSALSTISGSSILFHPNDNEVKAIIENANKMYDNSHFVM